MHRSDMKNQIKGAALCLFVAAIWGLSFVAQTTGMDTIDGFTFTGTRMMLAIAVLAPMALGSEKLAARKRPARSPQEKSAYRKTLWGIGALCGVCLFFGFNLQQFAFKYTLAGKIGFLTALYMIEVAILGALVLRKKIALPVWVSVALAMGGIFLLCVKPGTSFTVGRGEVLAMLCSIFFAVHILIVDKYAQELNVISLSCVQFTVAGAMSLVCMGLFEHPTLSAMRDTLPQLLYCGLMSCAAAFTLQLLGQKYADPVLASMMLCMESVFSVLFGWMFLHQSLSGRELTGCAVTFVAVFLTLVPQEFWQTLFLGKHSAKE